MAILGTCMAGMLSWHGHAAGISLRAFPNEEPCHRSRIRILLWCYRRRLVQCLCSFGAQDSIHQRNRKQDLWLSPAVILSIGAVMTFVSLLFSPETKDLELAEVEQQRTPDCPAGSVMCPLRLFATSSALPESEEHLPLGCAAATMGVFSASTMGAAVRK